jgi:hypothetical protein
MNIEFETRKIIIGGFADKEKVKLIQKFANFKREDIIFALNKRYDNQDNLSGKIYFEIARRCFK